MRVAMLGSRGLPAGVGGVERAVQELSRQLVARGHEVLVYSRRHYAVGAAAGAGCGRAVLTPGLAWAPLDALTHTATAAFDVLRRRADVVHVHSPGPALWSWLPAMGRVPIVLTVHAPDWQRQRWPLPGRLALRAGLAVGMRLAGAVTSVSAPLAEELARRFALDVEHVPNGFAPARPQGTDRLERLGLAAGDYALYVGRLVPEKRLDLLLRAWAKVPGERRLVVVAPLDGGRYALACRRAAGAGVSFVGPRGGRTLRQLYAHAAMVVQPSALEGMSLVLLEAAAHGRCVLAADIPANRAAMGEAILYFPVDDADNLAAEICRLWEREDVRQEMGRRAGCRAAAGAGWPEVAERFERIYARLPQRRSPCRKEPSRRG